MKTTISLFLILMAFSSVSQNLVPNGDFESYGDCSEGASFSILNDWFRPEGGGTPDFFHTCSNSIFPNAGAPSNIFGFQSPYSGNGYAGFATYVDNDDLIEYMRVELSDPLLPNEEYCLSFVLTWADSSSYTSNNLHVLFKEDNDWIFDDQDDGYAELAQVVFNDVSVVDGNSWKFFSKSFIAAGGERFMTVGNFLSNTDMDLSLIEYNQEPYYAYYFIDNVSLSSCETSVSTTNNNQADIVYDAVSNVISVKGTWVNTITVFDVSGKVVGLSEPNKPGSANMNINYLPAGLYVVHVLGEQEVGMLKIKKM